MLIDGFLVGMVFYGQSVGAATPPPAGYVPHDILVAEGVRPPGSSSSGGSGGFAIMAAAPPSGSAIGRTGWTVTCDSFQPGNECRNVIDGNTTTFWHTAYGPDAPLPHNLTVDMKSSKNVNGIGYLPRQDQNSHGNIAAHEIYLSTDGANWGSPIAFGTYWNDQTEKFTNFEPRPARFVRIIARSEVQGNAWTSVSEINVYAPSSYSPPPTGLGQWGPTIDFPVVPAGAWVEPVSGEVVVFSSHAHDSFDGGPRGITLTATWNPATNAVTQRQVSNTGHDMFCPGMSFDMNGRMTITGGNDASKTSVFDFRSDAWISASDMRIPRGYQSSATCADGRIFTIGGSWGDITRGGKDGEIFNPTTNTWTLLPNCPVAPMLTADKQGVFRSDNHAWLFGWKNNTVFQGGPSIAMNWYTTTSSGGVKGAGNRTGDGHSMCGIAVMYDAVNGKILTAGGSPDYQDTAATANAHIITINNPNATAQVTRVSSMSAARIFHNAVVLPNGNVFVAGGQQVGNPFYESTSQLVPEMFSPASSSWTLLVPNSIPRVYHSFALLLPDATILIGGGGLCGGGCSTNHFDAQIYTPQYLLTSSGGRASRPIINNASSASARVGTTITISTSGPVTSASLIRFGSATHTVNTDQRRIALTLTAAGTNKYSFAVPSDPGIALPGYWMIFASDSAGVPSIAKTVQITL